MSAETFVFTQLQSGALPTELSEVFLRTCLHYLTLINRKNGGVGENHANFGVFHGRMRTLSRVEGLWQPQVLWCANSTCKIDLSNLKGMDAVK